MASEEESGGSEGRLCGYGAPRVDRSSVKTQGHLRRDKNVRVRE